MSLSSSDPKSKILSFLLQRIVFLAMDLLVKYSALEGGIGHFYIFQTA